MQISIIIPTYNEAEHIATLVQYLKNHSPAQTQIIVSDGQSVDNTTTIALAAGAVALTSPIKGRAAQMNYGAAHASGDVLYFIHADTFPPESFANDILYEVSNGYFFGRYRTKFSRNNWLLKLNSYFTRFDLFVCYGGDQTLFMTSKLFTSIGGFNQQMLIMEDYDIITRAKKNGQYKIIQKDALVSARKYETNSWFRVQKANFTIVQLYKKGAAQHVMVTRYKQMLKYR